MSCNIIAIREIQHRENLTIDLRTAERGIGFFCSFYLVGLMYDEGTQPYDQTCAGSFDESACWVTDERLLAAHVRAVGSPARKGLELCCGTGVVGRALQTFGHSMIGLDKAVEIVEQTSQHFTCQQHNVEEPLPFDDDTFDFAIMRQSLSLIHPSKTLKEIQRVVRKGGKFVLSHTVPFSEVDAPWLEKIHKYRQPQFRAYYRREGIERALKESGLEVTDQHRLVITESISRWVQRASNLSEETRYWVYNLIHAAPEMYRRLRNVREEEGELLEEWNWVVFTSRVRK